MEFLIGAIVTMLAVFLANKFLIPNIRQLSLKVSYRQSDVFEAIRPSIDYLKSIAPRPETQALKYEARHMVKVLILEDKAYWIKDNSVFVADIIDGDVDKENAKTVDTMSMDKVQLDRLSFIVEKLTEGNSSDSGHPRFS